MAELTRERYRMAHHYFVYDTDVIDTAAVRRDAQARAFDKRKAEDSVIHYHPYSDHGCPRDCKPDEYEAGKGLLRT